MKKAIKFLILCLVLTVIFYQIMMATGIVDTGAYSVGDAVSRYLSGLDR